MKAIVKLSEKLTIELDGSTQKDIFEKLAGVQQVFGEPKCGKCGGTDLRFQVREVDGNKYYEMVCMNPKCYAKLGYGQNKVGDTLFPKRFTQEKGKDRVYLEDQGWVKWQKPAVEPHGV